MDSDTYVLLHCLVYIYTHHICIGYFPYVSVKIDQMHIKVDTSIYSFRSKLARHIMDTLLVTHLYIPKTLIQNLIKTLGLKTTWALLRTMLVGFAVSKSQ